MMIEASQIVKRYAAMESKRSPWDGIWDDLRRLIDPTARRIHQGAITSSAATEEVVDRYDVARLLDTTLAQAVQVTANGQLSHVTPVGEKWFSFDPPSSLAHSAGDFASWCGRATEVAQRAIAGSNFYDVIHRVFLDRTGYGVGCMYCGWSDKLGGLVFKSLPVGTYCPEEDEEGRVDTLFYRFNITPRQALQMFDVEGLDPRVVQMAADSKLQDDPLPFIHAVYPNGARTPGMEGNRDMAWVSVYVDEQHKRVVRVGGYDSFPFMVSRWTRWGDGPYGIGPAMIAAPVAKQANFLEAMADYACEKLTNPPVLIPAGFEHDIDSTPGGITYFDPSGRDSLPQEWQTSSAYQADMDRLQNKRDTIESICFVPLFRTISEQTKQMTAREVQERIGEQLSLFHPVFARLTVELLTPMLKRVLTLLIEHGVIPPPPVSVTRRAEGSSMAEFPDPQVLYSSRIALALKEQQTGGFYAMMELMVSLGQVAPDVLLIPNFSKAFREIARSRCIPEDWMHTDDEIAKLQEAQQEAKEAAAAPDAASKMARAVKDLGGPQQVQQFLGV